MKFTPEDYDKKNRDWALTFSVWRAFIKRYLLSYKVQICNADSILEIGSGNSTIILQELNKNNVKVLDTISDLNPDFCIDICNQSTSESYDVISCCDILEHTKRPWLAAQNIQSMMKSDTLVLLTVPCNLSWHPMGGPALYGDYWRFFPDSILLLFNKCKTIFNSVCEHPSSGKMFPIGICHTLMLK